jgi:XTP/dITP diphosphohydrolase
MEKFVLASGNEHKLIEIKKVLKDFGIEIVTMADVGLGDLEIVEDGKTFEENSLIKAKEVIRRTGLPTIADDSGLMVDYLDGAPGVYSARFAGENVTYEDNNDKLLDVLKNVPESNRGAKFVTVITLLFPMGDIIVARGEISGRILKERRGQNGFGYDPLFYVQEYEKSFAEMPLDLKNKISHRGKALVSLKEQLEAYYG